MPVTTDMTPSAINSLYSDHIAELDASVAGFHEGMQVIADKLLDGLIDIGADNSWQSQSLSRQIVHIQSQLRGQLNQLGHRDLAQQFINGYDESEIFAKQILETMGKLSGRLIPLPEHTVRSLKEFDFTAFNEHGNHIVRVVSRELALNVAGGKKRSDVIKSLTDALDGQVAEATLLADTSIRSYDRMVTGQLWTSAGIEGYRYYGPRDNRNRPFCVAHIGKIYPLTEIKAMSNGSTRFGSVWTYGGGPRCRHVWAAVVDEEAKDHELTPYRRPTGEPERSGHKKSKRHPKGKSETPHSPSVDGLLSAMVQHQQDTQ